MGVKSQKKLKFSLGLFSFNTSNLQVGLVWTETYGQYEIFVLLQISIINCATESAFSVCGILPEIIG